MKKIMNAIWAAVCVALLIFGVTVIVGALTGCVTSRTDPATGEVTYHADTNRLDKIEKAVDKLVTASAPVNPYAALIKPMIPTGKELIVGISGLAAIAFGWVKGKKAIQAENRADNADSYAEGLSGQLETKENILTAVISGVEKAGSEAKAKVREAAVNAGVQPELHAIVKSTTT